MWKALLFLQKNLIWSIPTCMVLGILFGYYYDPAMVKQLKQAVIPLTFLMVYPMMVNLDLKQVFSGGDLKLQGIVQLMNFGLFPFVGFAIGRFFFADQPLIVVGLLLTSLLPTSGMTISWTGFAKGNVSAAVKMTTIGLILGSLLTPFYLKFLVGTVIEIPLAEIFQQIIIIVFLPMALGYATQRFIIWKFGKEQYQKEYKPRFPALSTLGVLGVVFVAMALKAGTIVSDPTLLLNLLLPLLVLYGFNFILSTVAGKVLFGRADAIALVYGTVMRNLSIALAIAMTVFGENGSEIALIISVAYIIQVQAAAWYVKFTDRIFGSVAAAPAPVLKQEAPAQSSPPAPHTLAPALQPVVTSDTSPVPDILPQDWATTPPTVQATMLRLLEQVQMHQAQVATLQEQVLGLEGRLTQYTQSSSTPSPSESPAVTMGGRVVPT